MKAMSPKANTSRYIIAPYFEQYQYGGCSNL